MKKSLYLGLLLVVLLVALGFQLSVNKVGTKEAPVTEEATKHHWFVLHRKSNQEFLYFGEPGNKEKSELLKTFEVKTGIPGERPTPLPELLGREYWLITDKFETFDNPETAPYFLTMDVPVSEDPPYGPVPYLECDGQCDWQLPGSFGLHGINGNPEKLADSGSSGCVRHSDEDITYLYNLLDLSNGGVRYYIEDV